MTTSEDSGRPRSSARHRQRSEELYQLLFAYSPLPMWFFEIESRRFLAVNRAAIRHYGYSEAEFLSMTTLDIRSKEEQERQAALPRESFPEPRSIGIWKHRKKDGTEIDVEVTLQDVPSEGTERRLAVLQDVTQRRKAENALRGSEARFRNIFEQSLVGIYTSTEDGRLLECNEAFARMFGYGSIQEIMSGSTVRLYHRPEDRAAVVALLRQRGQVRDLEWEFRHKSGETIWLFGSASLIDSPDGSGKITTGLLVDITARKKIEQELRRSETMSAMGRLVAGVAHEVRNPLFAISGTIDAFEADVGDRVEFREYAAVLRREIERLKNLMRDLLEYGRPETSNPCPGPLRSVIERAASACALLARSRRVTIEIECEDDLPEVPMDSQRLVQVFQNLLQNAIEHSPEGGRVVVNIARDRSDPKFLICNVEDSGPGISDADLPLLFEPFFTRRRGGTGLGLSIVERIVQSHRGRILAGNRPGGGAVMTVRLPTET